MSEDPRVLVLGSDRHGFRVTAYPWDQVPRSLNVTDFDLIVLNLVPLGAIEDLRRGIRRDGLPSEKQFFRAFFAGASVIAVGQPDTVLGDPDGPKSFLLDTGWWLPLRLGVEHGIGERIEDVEEAWEFWFGKMAGYEWHFTGLFAKKDDADVYARDLLPASEKFGALPKALAKTRYGKPLGLAFRFSIVYPKGQGSQEAPGVVAWLPPLKTMDSQAAVELLLENLLSHGYRREPPSWTTEYELPREAPIRATIATLSERLEETEEALAAARAGLLHERRFIGLLFEQGKDVLEPLVRDALVELGADVAIPEAAGVEDARLTIIGQHAMVEIKGRKGPIKLEDVRQLDQWVRDAMANEDWAGKGLLIANAKLEEPPSQRTDLVGPQAEKFAKRAQICILTTPQIFEALRKDQLGELDREAFWRILLETDGIFQGHALEAAPLAHGSAQG